MNHFWLSTYSFEEFQEAYIVDFPLYKSQVWALKYVIFFLQTQNHRFSRLRFLEKYCRALGPDEWYYLTTSTDILGKFDK